MIARGTSRYSSYEYLQNFLLRARKQDKKHKNIDPRHFFALLNFYKCMRYDKVYATENEQFSTDKKLQQL
jgi:hypothetical protein